MQKQMIVTLPEELFDYSEVNRTTLDKVAEACKDFLAGDEPLLLLPDSFTYEITESVGDVSEVVITFDRGEGK